MPRRSRFTLRTLLGSIVVLSVPLAMIAAGQELGFVFLFPATGGCVGYLLGDRDGAFFGVLVGLIVLFALAMSLGPN